MTDPNTGRKIRELQTRFLFPFYLKPLDDHGMQAASVALEGADILQCPQLWRRAQPPALYTDELLQHVRDYLFADSKTPVDDHRCLYLKIPWMVPQAQPGNESANVIQKWFQGAALQLPGKDPPPCNGLPVRLVENIGIELWVSPHGAGVLSICVTPGKDVALTQEQAASYNYELAQLRNWSVAAIHKAHPADDPNKLSRIPASERAGIEPPPTGDAPLADRLTRRGGTFHLKELAAALLTPLRQHAELKLDTAPHQHTCTLYTMACFDDAVDFAVASIRNELAPFLSGLAQIEESTHAGAAPDAMNVESLLNNRKHWAAVGLLGAAHLLADQPPRPGQDEQRLPFHRMERVGTKYFVPYLLALMQRLSLNRAVDEASQFSHGEGEEGARRCKLLRADLVKFSVGGQFTQVHSRHALHNFYQIARKGLDVPGAWEQIRQAITDTDAQHSARSQEIMTQKMGKNLAIVAHTQQMVEWIEAFIISIYVGHFWHMLTADNTSLHDWVNSRLERWFGGDWHVEHLLVHGGVFVLTLCSLAIALMVLKPWKKDRQH